MANVMAAPTLRFGLCVANIGTYADPRATVRVAEAAERAGWEAVFVWDHLGFVWGPPSGDPWVTLAAVASATSTLRLGTTVTPVARRRPHVLAQTIATLDHLSDGRVVFGAGLGGVPEEFSSFGEEDDPHVRAERLDEGLHVLSRLWAGERLEFDGARHTVRGVELRPRPVQSRVPIWIGGNSRRALARAGRWDGWIADSADEQGMTMTPEELEEKRDTIAAERRSSVPFDVAVIGWSQREEQLPGLYAAAGATWWLETIHDLRGSPEELLELVEQGPARP